MIERSFNWKESFSGGYVVRWTDKVIESVQLRARLTALFLHSRSNILKDARCWEFSIAFDSAKNHGESYIDLRARLCINQRLHNLHILEIPLRSSHTGKMAEVVSSLFEALVGSI